MRIVQKSIVADRADSNVTAIAGSLTLTPGTAAVTYTPVSPPSGFLPTYTPNKFVTSSASGSGDGSDAGLNAWTLQQAMTSASAGDVVQVGPGDYSIGATGDRTIPAWNPTNSGLAGQPIIFFAQNRAGLTYQPGVTSRLNHTGGSGPVVGVNGRNYVTWDGFLIEEASNPPLPDTGPVVCWSSTNCSLLSLVVRGTNAPYTGDNHNGIRVELSNDCIVRDCYIDGTAISSGTIWNIKGIMLYSNQNIEIDHNTIIATSGIRVKEQQSEQQYGINIHHNYVDVAGATGITAGNGIGISWDTAIGTQPNYCYQNVCVSTDPADRGWFGIGYNTQTGAGFWIDNLKTVNNTVYNFRHGIRLPIDDGQPPTSGMLYQNNIWSDLSINAIQDGYANSLANFLAHGPFDYNIYQYGSVFADGYSGSFANGGYSYAQFKADGEEPNSPSSFNNPSDVQINLADPTNGDFTLASGSIALNAGIDALNLLGGGTSAPINCGAYILSDQSDQIGRRTA